jgi:hypothetical protein
MQLLNILREAIRAVPAMRYALAVAGLIAVVALPMAFKLDPKIAVFGAIITLGLMVALTIFAKLTTVAPPHFLKPVLFMMWSFLVLVIAQAALLLSAVSFQRPKPLYDWLFRPSGGTAKPQSTAEQEVAPEILQATEAQFAAEDYEGAWNNIEAGLQSAPRSRAAQELQARIAMGWIRAHHKFHTNVDRALPCLYTAAAHSNKVFAADANAHIGWANYLKSEDGPTRDTEGPLKRALALDPGNTYAHAMLGYYLVRTHKPFAEGEVHFKAALESGRDKSYVQYLKLWLLTQPFGPKHVLPLISYANELRKRGETLNMDWRERIVRRGYMSEPETILANVNGMQPVLPASEHLATLKWLRSGSEDSCGSCDLVIARLTEQTGDRPGALALYRTMESLAGARTDYADQIKEIKEGIRRNH